MPKLKYLSVMLTGCLLTACGTKLLWQSIYESPEPKAATALAVDAANNSYVGGSRRMRAEAVSDDERDGYNLAYDGLLLKYDTNGALQWQVDVPNAFFIVGVHVLDANTLVVITGYPGSWPNTNDPTPLLTGRTNTEAKAAEAWLVSSRNGNFLKKIDDFEATENGVTFTEAQVVDGIAYIAESGTNSSLKAFDHNGDLIGTWPAAITSIADINIANSQILHVVTTDENHNQNIIQLNQSLHPEWELNGSAIGDCATINIASDSSNIFAICHSNQPSVSRIDNAGNVVFSTNLGVLAEESSEMIETLDLSRAKTQIDSTGNLYITATKTSSTKDENHQIGMLNIISPSALKSDTMLIKIDGHSGAILWHDTIKRSLLPAGNTFTSAFFYPMALSLHDNKPLLTVRALIGTYRGIDDSNECFFNFEQWWDYSGINSCELVKLADQYAKTFVYDNESGARIKSAKHALAYPRAVQSDESGNVFIVGDQDSDVLDLRDTNAIGAYAFESWELSTKSDIVLQKHKLFDTK